MLIKKVKRYASQKGLKALTIKVFERIKYKKETLSYMKNNNLKNEDIIKQRAEKYTNKVTISICVPVYNTDRKYFQEMLNSVINQSYVNWELCIADGSTEGYEYIKDIVDDVNDDRIIYKKLSRNMGIVENSNEAAKMAKGEYIALLDHDDVLSLDALYYVRKEIDKDADYIYSDEASFSKNINKPDIIHFKPDYSVFNLRGNNYICHLSVFKRSLFEKVGGFRQGFDGSQDHDLILRLCEISNKIVHIPRVLYFWRVHRNSVAMDISAKPYCLTTGVRAVESHLKRMGITATVSNAASDSAVYKVEYKCTIRPVVINDIKNINAVTNEYIIVADKNIDINSAALRELAQYIQLKNVGIVCGIIVKNGRIQCGGITKDLKAGYKNTSILSEGYMKRLKYAHSVYGATPELFAVKKSLVEAMGGFDFSLDNMNMMADISEKLRRNGYETVLNPYCVGVIKN